MWSINHLPRKKTCLVYLYFVWNKNAWSFSVKKKTVWSTRYSSWNKIVWFIRYFIWKKNCVVHPLLFLKQNCVVHPSITFHETKLSSSSIFFHGIKTCGSSITYYETKQCVSSLTFNENKCGPLVTFHEINHVLHPLIHPLFLIKQNCGQSLSSYDIRIEWLYVYIYLNEHNQIRKTYINSNLSIIHT